MKPLKLLVALVIVFLLGKADLYGQGGYVYYAAGDGVYGGGYSGDGGPALNAKIRGFGGLGGLVEDAMGNKFFFDYSNRIRKISATTNIITTIAGTGVFGYSGDGGAATSANIEYGSLGIDALGNLYLARGARVRKVNVTTGIITTVAGNGDTTGNTGDGGAAINAGFGDYMSIYVDWDNNIYIASNNTIRKINGQTGIIQTIGGGNGAGYSGDGGPALNAQINTWLYSIGMVKDNFDNLYFTDVLNHRIRQINETTGIISTTAGTGVVGDAGDGGPAVSAQLSTPNDMEIDLWGNLFFNDINNWGIRKIDMTTGIITKVAGGRRYS